MQPRSLKAPKHEGKSKQEQLTPDSYPARLVSFIHLGTQPPSPKAKFPKDALKIRMTWEFPTELREFKEGEEKKPVLISREFPFSMYSKSALRPFVESMIGTKLDDDEADEFDILSLMEKEYLVTTVLNDSWYADIQSVIRLPKAMPCPPQITPTQIILIEDWENDMDSLPEFLQDKIKRSREWERQSHEDHEERMNQIDDDLNEIFPEK